MKLLKLHIQDEFRSLHEGFSIDFHKGMDSMDTFQPFCFAGLNGSGKSNVLEALACIFYHLECCVAEFRPQSFEKYFREHESTPDAFTLEYLIREKGDRGTRLEDLKKIRVSKEKGKPAIIYVFNGWNDETHELEMSLGEEKVKDAVKNYLPDQVVAYSSGENETLSLPFIKSRLINYDNYCEDFRKKERFDEPESTLIYIDEAMSQAVLLAALLFEDSKTLKPLRRELGVQKLESFTIILNSHFVYWDRDDKLGIKTANPILDHVATNIELFKKCATSWFKYSKEGSTPGPSKRVETIQLDFQVDDSTKEAFQKHFKSSFDLFRFFQTLYELNSNIVSDRIKEEVYSSKGFYTKGKLPIAAPVDTVFHFLDYKILKKIKGQEKPKALLLREFSDGEQQFLHTIGICLMLKDRRTLLLLDEPETHFNPAWRAKFIKILNDSITAGSLKDGSYRGHNIHLRKDVLITSHSPFIISDCMPNNVIFFKRNKETELVEAKSAKELEFNTFGTSVEIILDELFNYNQSIGDWSNEELLKINFDSIKTEADKKTHKRALRKLGSSIEKDLVLAKLNRIEVKE